MFTGIIQCTGILSGVVRTGDERRFTIRPAVPFSGVQDGESIAHNGVCLSVESHTAEDYVVYASAETVNRSTLGSLSTGDEVNLERALALGDRLGGHLVSGHVDCVATVRSVEQAGSSLRCTLAFPPAFAAEVIEKGSVTLDGITVDKRAGATSNTEDGDFYGKDFLTVNVIPDTQKRTTMLHWRPGSRVNMETDLIGKYVRRIMQCQADGPATPQKSSGINKEFLLQNGFL